MKFVRWTILFMLMSAGVLAQDIKVIGSIDKEIKIPSKSNSFGASPAVVKHIALLKIELSGKAREIIYRKAEEVLRSKETLSARPPKPSRQTQLGMGTVPVLDQGGYGSCVTFANTAAIDAVLNKGDYISQLCLLQLGTYLENNGYTPSGWDGSLGGIVLNQMNVFGLVSKAQQQAIGCGGLTQYPLGGMNFGTGTAMTPEEYHPMSVSMDVAWSSILDSYQVVSDKVDPNDAMNQVKMSLDGGDRLTFGVLLPPTAQGMVGAVGSFHTMYDSWVLTSEIVEEMKSETDFPGHEMVITGYDDGAVAIDNQGRAHRGLLTLRNSWGTRAGDRGNFYMSYDYFKALTIEVQRIRQ